MCRPAFMLLALFMALPSCDDSNDDDDGVPSQGAFIGVFSSISNVPGKTCDKDLHTGQVGYVDVSEIRDMKTDGEDGAEIDCTVESSGDGFRVEASIAQGGTALTVDLPLVTHEASETAPALGVVTYLTRQTDVTFSSANNQPCTFWLAPNSVQEVARGRAWLSFECLVVEGDGNQACKLTSTSAFAVQNCR